MLGRSLAQLVWWTTVAPLLWQTLAFEIGPVNAVTSSQTTAIRGYVCVNEEKNGLFISADPINCIAEGRFREEIYKTGWNRLTISHQDTFLGFYAAGFAEGFLMSQVVKAHVRNVRKVYEYGDLSALYKYYAKSDERLQSFIKLPPFPGEEAYHQLVRNLRAQFEGILDGVNFQSSTKITLEDLYLLNTDGDIENLLTIVSFPSATGLPQLNRTKTRCSALIKVAGDEVFFGHTTWEGYGEMNRVLKSYSSPKASVLMSSYPGVISSTDDFILTSKEIAVMETSLEYVGDGRFGEESGLPSFIRVQAAAFLSESAARFIEYFLKYNSETYFSQWMILDYKEVGKPHWKDAFYVLETAPNSSLSGDFSSYLQNTSFWSSVNWPYFPQTISALGYSPTTIDRSVRKRQFSTLQEDVSSLEDMQYVMQFNNWSPLHCDSQDPLHSCSPTSAISSRFDLDPQYPELFGGTDSKVTSRDLAKSLSFLAISGPTHQDLPPFRFSGSDRFDYLPDLWDFEWVHVTP